MSGPNREPDLCFSFCLGVFNLPMHPLAIAPLWGKRSFSTLIMPLFLLSSIAPEAFGNSTGQPLATSAPLTASHSEAAAAPSAINIPFLNQIIQAFPALASSKSLHFDGTVQWVAGSLHETGTVSFDLSHDGSSTTAFTLPTKSQSESQTAFSARTCSWLDRTGKTLQRRGPDCYRPLPWVAPQLLLLPDPTLITNFAVTDDGLVTEAGTTYHQLSYLCTVPATDSATTTLFTNATRVRVLFDLVGLLPSAMEFEEHPQGNLNQQRHVRIVYRDYSPSSGLPVAHHIDRYVNSALQASITIGNSTIL